MKDTLYTEDGDMMQYGPYPWAFPIPYPPNTSNPIAKQTEATYLDYEKLKDFQDVGLFLETYIVLGGYVSKNVTHNNMIDVSPVVVSINGNLMQRDFVNFTTSIPSATYYLDFTKEGDYSWNTSHPEGAPNVDYMQLAQVTTDAAANVSVITDEGGVRGGFRLKPSYQTNFLLNPLASPLDMNGFPIHDMADPTEPQDAITLKYAQDRFISNPLTTDLDVNSKKLTNVATPTADGDATNKQYVDAGLAEKADKQYVDDTFVPLAGGTMTGPLVLQADPTTDLEASTKQYVDTGLSSKADNPLTTDLNANSHKVTNLATPTTNTDAATKEYVDNAVSTGGLTNPLLVNLDYNGNKGINLATPTANGDAANKVYVDSEISDLETSVNNELDTKAPINNPTFTGTANIPTLAGVTSTSVVTNLNSDAVDGVHFRTTSGVLEYSTDGVVWNPVGDRILSMTPNQINYVLGVNATMPAGDSLDLFTYNGSGIIGEFYTALVGTDSNYSGRFGLEIVIDGTIHRLYNAIGNGSYTTALGGNLGLGTSSSSRIVPSVGQYSFSTSIIVRVVNTHTASNTLASGTNIQGVFYT